MLLHSRARLGLQNTPRQLRGRKTLAKSLNALSRHLVRDTRTRQVALEATVLRALLNHFVALRSVTRHQVGVQSFNIKPIVSKDVAMGVALTNEYRGYITF